MHMGIAHAADSASDHHRLVVAAHRFTGAGLIFEGAKVAINSGPTKFIIKTGRAYRSVQHNIQRRHHVIGLASLQLPRLWQLRQIQMRGSEACQSSLGLGATTYRTFVAYLTTRPGGSTREGRNRSRMIMGFYLHQNMCWLRGEGVLLRLRIDPQPIYLRAFNHRRIVAVGAENALSIDLTMSVANHAEQRTGLRHLIHKPVGVKNFMPTMLRVCLGKHHQLDVRRITLQHLIGMLQIFEFVC